MGKYYVCIKIIKFLFEKVEDRRRGAIMLLYYINNNILI